MVAAAEQFVAEHRDHRGSLAFLITSDEEGVSVYGTRRVMEVLEARGEKIIYCLIGEPSCEKVLGDTIKIDTRSHEYCERVNK